MHPPLVSFLFTVFFISVTATKLLRLLVNAHSFPVAVFIFCLPAFVFTDLVLISTVWALLRRKNGVLGAFGLAVGCIIW